MNALNNIKLGAKLIGGFMIVAVLLVGMAVYGSIQMNSMQSGQNELYKDRLIPIEQLDDINIALYKIRGEVYKSILLPEERTQAKEAINTAIASIDKNIEAYSASFLLQAEKEELARLTQTWATYQQEVANILAKVEAGQEEEAIKALVDGGAAANARKAVGDSAEKLREINSTQAARLHQEFDSSSTNARNTFIIISVLAVVVAIGLGIILTRSITGPMNRGVAMMQEMGRGHLGMRLNMNRKDEIGGLAQAMDGFADDLQNTVIGAIKHIAAGRLDDEMTPKDAGDEITPAIKATIESLRGLVAETGMLSKAAVDGRLDTRGNPARFEGGYRQIVQGVNDTLDAVIGPLNVAAEYVDRISKGDIPAKITDTYHGDFNEIKNNLNQCIDAVNGLVAEAVMLAKAAVDGRLDTRGNADKFQGDFRRIVQGVNDTLDAVIGPLNVAAEYVDRISKGDIPTKITDTYHGDFNEIKNNLNQCIDAVNGLVADAAMLSRAAVEGKLATRADAGKHQGDFRKIVQGVDDTLDAVIGPLNVAAEYVDRISKGDIPAKITDTYHGDFNEIKNNLNQCIDAVNGLVAETGMLTKAAVEGRLDTRGNPARFQGDFCKIVQGVNDTLDAVIGPLNVAAEYVDRISKGDIPAKITDTYHGDFNEIKNNLNQCIDAISTMVEQVGIVIQAGHDGHLAKRADADRAQGVYRKILRGVNDTLDAIIGPLNVSAEYVDRISKGDIPARITDTYHGDFNEIKNNLNQCIDSLNGLIAEMRRMSDEHNKGDIDVVIPVEKFSGAYQIMAQGVNDMVAGHIVVKKKAMACVAEFGRGNFEAPLDRFPGKKAFINDTIEQVRLNLKALIADADMLSKAAVEGKLDTRADAGKHEGDFRKIVQGVNNTLDAVIGPLNVAAEYVDRIGKGDIPAKITDTYHGDFNEIKNNLNQCIDAVNGLVAEAVMLTKAAIDGRLDTRGNADKFQGDFRRIVQGVNDTLDAVIGPLNVAAEYVDRISKGDIPAKITDAYHGDFNEIKNNLNQLIDSLNEITGVTVKIAAGNLKVEVRPRSSQDELMKSLSAMLDYLQEMAAAANGLAAGNLNISISPKSKEDVLGNAFAEMIANLQQVIGDIVQISQMLAEGDLRVKPEAEYLGDFVQIKTGLETALAGLNKTMQQTTLVVTQVGDSVEQVRTIGQDMASNSEEQSSAAEEVAASLQETDSQVKANAENAGVANQLVNNTALAADSGQKKMKLMTEAMGAIAQSSRMIGNIIKVIDEIAFQTNLLALNAAVEAARAGQHGRGFAVVAQEVRNLAGRSAKAAKETAELIEDSGRRVEEGVRITGETAASLGEIVQNVVKVKDLVAEIAAASEEQSRGIAQIGSAMTQVSQGAQSSSRQSEELAGSADELAGLAEQLSQEVSRFKLLEQENSRGVAKPSRKIPYGNGKPPAKSGKTTARSFDRDERGYEGF